MTTMKADAPGEPGGNKVDKGMTEALDQEMKAYKEMKE